MKRTSTPPDKAYDALIAEARDALRAHDYGRAEHLAREGLAHAPERAAAYNILASTRGLQGHQPEAMDLLRAGIAVEPTYGPAQKNLAQLGSDFHQRPILLGDEDEDE